MCVTKMRTCSKLRTYRSERIQQQCLLALAPWAPGTRKLILGNSCPRVTMRVGQSQEIELLTLVCMHRKQQSFS